MSPAVRRATAVGAGALALWTTLGLLATAAAAFPPLQLTGLAFALAGGLCVFRWLARGERPLERMRAPLGAWALGVGGLFLYHALYFAAVALAPPVEANLVNYLWPLLIVLFSGLLPGERLRWPAVAGAALGFAGCAALLGPGAGQFSPAHLWGYAAAFGAAVTWGGYSVLSRRYAHVPSDAVGGFCLGAAALAFAAHAVLEDWATPGPAAWAAAVATGLGPVGLAFFLWDHGVKRGDIRLLGVLAYAVPLVSTLLLIAFGRGALTPSVGIAAALIVGGAALAGLAGKGRA